MFDSGIEGRAAVFPYVQRRLPWMTNPINRLLVTICKDELGIYKYPEIPSYPLPYADAMVLTRVISLRTLSEFFEWPYVEAITSGYSGELLEDTLPTSGLTHVIMAEWHRKPFTDGKDWWVINRGPLGVSFLRDLENGNCIEIRTARIMIYNGPLSQNEALLDNRVIQTWQLHDFDKARPAMTDLEYMVCRALIRNIRYRIWLYACEQDLPF